jgi:uncharacterized membrane protein
MTTMHSGSLPTRPTDRNPPIALVEPLRWLSLGLRDFGRAPGVGLAYGLMVTVLGWVVLALGNHPYFIAAAVSGFLLLGPILGAGLIEASRVLGDGRRPTFDSSLRGLDRNRGALERLALALLAIAAVWLTLSTTLLIAALGPIAPGVEQALWDSALRFMSSTQLLAWLATGAVLMLACFSISVIAVPMIQDQQVGAGEAMLGSFRAVIRHPLACAAWALLIVLLTALGFATALIGFIAIYPVLGHASWHAYRALRR